MRLLAMCCLAGALVSTALAQENYESWPVLKSSFPSTGGGGITIKGYDPVITGNKCVTTFMAVESGSIPNVYPNVIEFEAVPMQGGNAVPERQVACVRGRRQRNHALPRFLQRRCVPRVTLKRELATHAPNPASGRRHSFPIRKLITVRE